MSRMRSIAIKSVGSDNELYLERVDIPKCGPNDVLIQIYFAGVNRPDILQKEGKYLPPVDASPILGLEASGKIVGMGKSVTKWRSTPIRNIK